MISATDALNLTIASQEHNKKMLERQRKEYRTKCIDSITSRLPKCLEEWDNSIKKATKLGDTYASLYFSLQTVSCGWENNMEREVFVEIATKKLTELGYKIIGKEVRVDYFSHRRYYFRVNWSE